MSVLITAGQATARVPATSANLGPGFDALGLALSLYDDVTARVRASGLTITATGEGSQHVPRDDSHLIVRTMRATFLALDVCVSGLELECANRIPHGRGLGSSAAAICAGVLLARQLTPDGGGRLDDNGVLALAGRLEGHPDNVAPCLLGGLTVAWTTGSGTDAGAHAVRVEPLAAIRPIAFIPPFESSTEHARTLLPADISHRDAAFNAGRAALLIAALTTDAGALMAATEDRLHQPFRAPAMPDSAALVAALRTAGVPAVISGAGPTVLALARDDTLARVALDLAPPGWRAAELPIERVGATVRST